MSVFAALKNVKSKVAQVWPHPLMSPVTMPLNMIARTSVSSVRNVFETLSEGYADERSLMGAWKGLFGYRAAITTGLISFMGCIVGGLGTAITAGVMTTQAGFSLPVIAAATGTALGAGVLLGPIAATVGVMAVATAGAALIFGPLGFLAGCFKAARYAVGGKNAATSTGTTPSAAVAAASDSGAPAGTYSLQQLRAQFGIQVKLPDVVDQLNAMTKGERERQIESLAETFNAPLRAAMREDVGESMTLSSRATAKPARLKIGQQ